MKAAFSYRRGGAPATGIDAAVQGEVVDLRWEDPFKKSTRV